LYHYPLIRDSLICDMTIYKKAPHVVLNKIIHLLVEGKSKENVSYLTGLSENKVFEIIEDLNSPEYSNLIACHLVLNLHKDGQDAKELAELIQLTDMLTHQGVVQKDALELATDIAEFCHKIGLGPNTLVTCFKGYYKIAPNNMKTFKDLQTKFAKVIESQKYLRQEMIALVKKHNSLNARYNRENDTSQ
jgi:hypothetical protein